MCKFKKVFVIEDDEDIREALTDYLIYEGHEVESFSDGKQALERLKVFSETCLILLDVVMPIMGGFEFMLEYSKLPVSIIPIPIYLISASESGVEASNLGAIGFIKKPVDLDIILKIINMHCKDNVQAA